MAKKDRPVIRTRSLKQAGVRTERHPLVKAADVTGPFTIVGAFLTHSRFGDRVCFDIVMDEGDGEVFTLMLAADGYRQSIADAVKENGPLGPVVLTEVPTSYGNPYWRIEDAAEDDDQE